MLGDGDGTFKFPVRYYNTWGCAIELVVEDFNKDGLKDILYTDPHVCGAFRYPIITPFLYNSQLKIESLNSLSSTTESDYLSILMGKGDGTFMDSVDYPVGKGPCCLIVDDFNLDGFKDIAVLNSMSKDISILLGKGDGGFNLSTSYGAGELPGKLVKGDFNGDGMTDLGVISSPVTFNPKKDVRIFLGKGDGTFSGYDSYDPGFIPVDMVAGDFNQDGLTDLVVTGYNTDEMGRVSVLIAKDSGEE